MLQTCHFFHWLPATSASKLPLLCLTYSSPQHLSWGGTLPEKWRCSLAWVNRLGSGALHNETWIAMPFVISQENEDEPYRLERTGGPAMNKRHIQTGWGPDSVGDLITQLMLCWEMQLDQETITLSLIQDKHSKHPTRPDHIHIQLPVSQANCKR